MIPKKKKNWLQQLNPEYVGALLIEQFVAPLKMVSIRFDFFVTMYSI